MANRFLSNIRINDAYTLPASDGSSGQVITTDGSGNLSFVDPTSGAATTALSLNVTVKNVSGGSLAKGTVVHAHPSATPPSGNIVEVVAADYDDTAYMPAIGVLNETLANEAEGDAIMFGAVSGIDTSSFSAGDELWVGNNGAFTNTKPATAGQLIQKIAVVIKSHATAGLIKVFGAGRTNDVPLPLYIDNTNQNVGIGTFPDSDSELHVYKNGGPARVRIQREFNPQLDLESLNGYARIGTLNNFPLAIQTSGSERMRIDANGNIGIGDTNPSQVLSVNGTASATVFYDYTNSAYYLNPDNANDSIRVAGAVVSDLLKSLSQGSESFINFDDDNFISGATNALNISSKSHMVFVTDTNSNGTVEHFGFYTQGTTDATATKLFEIKQNGNIDVTSGAVQVGGTTVIDSSRNLTNIGTISSGDITINKAVATINMGYQGGPHGINFYDDGGGNNDLRWGFYYRTSPDTITFETGGTSAKFTLDTSGNLDITGDLSAVDANLTGALKGPSTFYIDPSPDDTGEPGGATTDTGTVVILGDLQVTGTTTTIDSTTLNVGDLNIVLAKDATTAAAANGAGITINGANATMTYDSTNDRFNFNKAIASSTHVTSGANVYSGTSGQFRNYAGVWTATTGISGNGFQFISADGTAMTISSVGNVVTSGTLEANGSFKLDDVHILGTGAIGLNRDTSNGNIYNSNYSAFQLQHNRGVDVFELQAYNNAGTFQDRFVFTNTGNFGIGTFTPGLKLTVNGAMSAHLFYDYNDTSYFVNPNSTTTSANFAGKVQASQLGVTNIVTNKVVKFNGSILDDSNITDTGSLITLGSQTTVSGNLEAEDYIKITNTGGQQRLLLGNQDSSGVNNPAIIAGANGNTYIGGGNTWSGNGGTMDYTAIFTNGGDVGIGTNSPTGKFNIRQSTLDLPSVFLSRYNSDDEPILQIGEATHFSGSSTYGEALIHSFNRDIVFSTQATQTLLANVTDTPALIIEKGNGDVGVGISDPIYKLDVNGTLGVRNGTIQTNGSTTSFNFLAGSAAKGAKVGFLLASNSYSTTPASGVIEAQTDMRAPIYYDANNTGYYVNPQGTSKVAILLVEDQIRTGNGQQLVLNAGESHVYATGQTGELVYINAEGGLRVSSSPDNWSSGWAGRHEANICDSSGNSQFPGTVRHEGLNMSSGDNIDQLHTFGMGFTLTALTWTDTGISHTDLPTGTYTVQVYVDDHNAGGQHYDEYYSGTMSWYAGNTNSTNSDEIVLHNAGHASGSSYIQLRTERHTSTNGTHLMLQVKQNFNHSQALNGTDGRTMTFKFRRLL